MKYLVVYSPPLAEFTVKVGVFKAKDPYKAQMKASKEWGCRSGRMFIKAFKDLKDGWRLDCLEDYSGKPFSFTDSYNRTEEQP